MSTRVFITETVLRDAHQCLIATRLKTADMLPVCPLLDQVGYWSLEAWGGATFDACLRFLKEDPWDRLRQLKKALPHTPIQMLLRGQNLLGYRHYADDVVEAFIQKSAEWGVDIFRVFDALNDVRNLLTAIKTVKEVGKHAQGAIVYTISPIHTVAQYVELAHTLQDLGCDSIVVKDMAGLLTPQTTQALISALVDAVKIPIHLHTHATSGLALLCLMTAIAAGCRHVDTALSAFAEGASQPCTESLVLALKDTSCDTQLNLLAIDSVASHFRRIRPHYQAFESEATRLDPRVHIYQIPGGMISNLHQQLQMQGMLDKLDQVQQEILSVRKDLGYPPLVTPLSQIVAAQAVLNVQSGDRYGTITHEVKRYCQGQYGKTPGPIDVVLKQKAIGKAEVIDSRPADELKEELPKAREKSQGLAKSPEDVLSYALFPDVAKVFLQERAGQPAEARALPAYSAEDDSSHQDKTHEFNLSLHGENYHIVLTGSGSRHRGKRAFYVTVDGVPEEVILETLDREVEPTSRLVSPSESHPGLIKATMPGTVVDVKVKVGEKVRNGDPLIVLEAMKMQTEVLSTVLGAILTIYVAPGDKVVAGEVLLDIKPAD